MCLPGHGRRGAEAGPEIDLHRHAQSVVDHVEAHDLREVMLVRHSYGGMPVTQAWDALRDRVAAVVYVDAGIAVDGQCQLDLLDGEPGWTVVEVDSGHNLIAERPDELVRVLLECAAADPL